MLYPINKMYAYNLWRHIVVQWLDLILMIFNLLWSRVPLVGMSPFSFIIFSTIIYDVINNGIQCTSVYWKQNQRTVASMIHYKFSKCFLTLTFMGFIRGYPFLEIKVNHSSTWCFFFKYLFISASSVPENHNLTVIF